MAHTRIILLSFLLFNSFLQLYGQQSIFSFQRFNLQQGLSQGSVHCMLQDHKGFMWFGTQDGLNQFDGYQFTVYRHNAHDSTTISDNFINAVHEDKDGNIWVGTYSGGLNCFNRLTGTFKSFIVQDDPGSISSNRISTIYHDQQGNLWIGTDNGLNKLVTDSSGRVTFKKFFHDPENTATISSNDIKVVYQDVGGELWIGTSDGLNKYNPQAGYFQRFYPDPEGEEFNHITAIHGDYRKDFLIGTYGGGLFKVSFTTGARKFKTVEPVTFQDIQHNQVSAIISDPRGQIWIGFQEEGMIRWDSVKNQHLRIRTDPAQPASLSNDMVYSLYHDSFGNLWVGTLDGINKYNQDNQKFTFYQNQPGAPGHIYNSIFAILKEANGNIWSGSRDGLFCLDSLNRLRLFKQLPGNPGSIHDDAIRSLHQSADGGVWVGTEKGTLERFDPQKKIFRAVVINPALQENAIYTIREDENHTFWLGTTDGLYSFDPKSEKIEHFDWQQTIRTSTKSREIRSIEVDGSGNLWIGTRGAGLFYFDKRKKSFQNFQHDPNDPFSISHNVVASIYIDDEAGTIWLGTASGFNRFDQKERKFYSFNEKDGMPNDVTYGILPDDVGFLWLSTNNGLVKFDPVKKTFRTYDTSDGLQSNEFNAGAYYRSKDGELFFGGINGFNSFYPDKVKDNALLPAIVLTGFKVFNEAVDLKRAFEYVDQIDLSHEDYVFSLEFSAIHLTAPEKNNYAYKLEGFDPSWVHTKRRFATYTNLDPGTYTFRVKASNNDGIWNEEGLAIKIYIEPPFWKTWWFYALIVILLGGIVYGIYRFRIGQIRKEEKLKTEFNKKLAEVEMTALRAQMNPHFLFNCLNSINRYIVKSDPERASSYLTKFSRLIRLILQNSKASTVSLKNELEALKLYIEMEEMRFENKFDYRIEVDKGIEPEFLEVPPLLLQPYVENAIWHGLMHKESRGQLTIVIADESHRLKCIIEDNGIGRKRAEQLKSKSATRDKSMGMKITTDRLKLYQTHTRVEIIDLINAAGEPTGTRVVLDIPYSIEQQALHVLS